jgi:hypothetical protein
MISIVMLIFLFKLSCFNCYAECHCAKCRNAVSFLKCRAFYCYAECHCASVFSAMCHVLIVMLNVTVLSVVMLSVF